MSYKFSGNFGNIDDLAAIIRSNPNYKLENTIKLFQHKGKIYTLDHRRWEAYKRAGVDIPAHNFEFITRPPAPGTWARGRYDNIVVDGMPGWKDVPVL